MYGIETIKKLNDSAAQRYAPTWATVSAGTPVTTQTPIKEANIEGETYNCFGRGSSQCKGRLEQQYSKGTGEGTNKAKPRKRRKYVDYDSATGKEERERLKELILEYRHDMASLPCL